MASMMQKFKDLAYNLKHPYNELEENRYKILAVNSLNNMSAVLVGGNFLTGLLIYLNANTVELGLITMIVYICNILQILSPLLLSRFEQRKKLLIGSRILSYIMNIVLIGVASILPIGNRAQVYMILACTAVLNITSAFTAQGFSLWHYQSIPENRRADHFSQNSIIVTITGNLITFGAGAALDLFKSNGMELFGMNVLRIIALVFAAADIYYLSKIKEYPYGETIGRINLKKIFTEPFKHKRYLLSIITIFCWNFFGGTNGAYFSVYLLDNLHVSYSFLNIISIVCLPVLMIMNPIWAKYIKHRSWFPTLYKTLFAYAIIHLMYAFVIDGMAWFYVIPQLCIAFVTPAVSNIITNLSFYNLPRESQSICLPFCSTFTYLGALCGSGHALLFMTLFEDLTITVFGITFVSYQIIMAVTSCYVGLFGVIAYFINKKDIAMQKLEEMKPINS